MSEEREADEGALKCVRIDVGIGAWKQGERCCDKEMLKVGIVGLRSRPS